MDQDDKSMGDMSGGKEEEAEEPPPPPPAPDVQLIVDGFGIMPARPDSPAKKRNSASRASVEEGNGSVCRSSTSIDVVRRYTWITKNRLTVQIITYGATIQTIRAPDKKGNPADVVAGFDTLEEYFQPRNPYFGAAIGRYANYVRNGTAIVRPSGRMYNLTTNKGHHHYNGGYQGFDKVNWRSYVVENKVIMSHISSRMSEGYPGDLITQITFEVTCDNTLKIEMRATTTEPTLINFSYAPFFNLFGHHAGPEAMMDHIFTINGDKYLVNDEEGLPTGEKRVVGGSAYDFRIPRILKVMLPKIPLGGYDLNYCITQGVEQDLTFQARALHPGSGRVLEVYSNQPGMQFYTGSRLPDPDRIINPLPTGEEARSESGESEESEGELGEDEGDDLDSKGQVSYGYVPLGGKDGTFYKKNGLFCLLPQNYPDAINNRSFPNSVLNPGEEYVHRIQYKFGILLGRLV